MKKNKILLLLGILFSVAGCNEQYLDKKPDKSQVVPTTLADFQALLDYSDQLMNVGPALGFISSDDAYTSLSAWNSWTEATAKNAYTYSKEIYNGESPLEWSIPYKQVLYANLVLEGLANIEPTNASQKQWTEIRSSALYFRAQAYYDLAQLFAPQYDSLTAGTDMGIPLRLSSDINAGINRGTVKGTYQQILADLNEALTGLPSNVEITTRPSIAAGRALLAKTYLIMGDYGKAHTYADEVINADPTLLDYNTVDTTSFFPFPLFNNEIIFYSRMITYEYTFYPQCLVDSAFYNEYDNSDLRKIVYFEPTDDGQVSYTGSYAYYNGNFGGIAKDEIFLIDAESRCRAGDIQGALSVLNALLVTRFKTGTYAPLNETDNGKLLSIILTERKKELVMRNTRWSDLRRLNKDPRFAVTLTHSLDGKMFTLPPNDLRYTFPIPDAEIAISGLTQNPR